MSKTLAKWVLLILTICFLILGFIFKSTAENYEGSSFSTGAIIDGEYVETDSGKYGADSEKYDSYNNGGTAFYVFAGIAGVACVITFILDKKSE